MTRPVGSGKTALLLALCRALREEYNIGEPHLSPFTASPFPIALAHPSFSFPLRMLSHCPDLQAQVQLSLRRDIG